MLRRIVLVIFTVATTLSFGQNLVLNPGFECGEDFCGAFQSSQSSLLSKHACDWMAPGDGTTDIHSTLLPAPCFNSMPYRGGPHDYVGSQLPRNGNRFAGIYTYMPKIPADSNYREYLEGKLTETLVPGEVYCTELYASRAEYMHYASNHLGIRFNVGPTFHMGYRVLNQVPQIQDENIITDTAGWTRVGGMFTATEPATRILIGNFTLDRATSSIQFSNAGYEHAYYFIEDVSVEKLPADSFVYSGDTAICTGDMTTLSADARTSYVIWQNISKAGIVHVGRNFEMKPDETTSYLTIAKGCGKEVRDTITVYVHPRPTVDLGADTTICEGVSIKLHAGKGYQSYKWQDQSSGDYLLISEPGTYSITVSNGIGCEAHDEKQINITLIPKVDLGPDQLICSRDFPTLRAGPIYDEYMWSGGSTDSLFTPTQAGEYEVVVRNQCGGAKDTIRIYSSHHISLPNVLTPNGDDRNEKLKVVPEILTYGLGILKVYNRWGGEVYIDENYEGNWPSTPDDLLPGTYYYSYQLGECPPLKGFIQIVK